MKNKFTFTQGRWIGFICCALLPLMAMGLGMAFLANGVMFNRSIGLTFFLFELIALCLLALCIFSRIKPWIRVVLSIVILILFLISFFFGFWFSEFVKVKHYEGSELEPQYHAAIGENTLMPELSQIGEPAQLEYKHIFAQFFIFSSETDYLICRYSPEEYEIQKARLDSLYTFQTEPINNYDSVCEPMVEIDGYLFRMLSTDAYADEAYLIFYPKKMLLIGCSDDAGEIVYLAFEDIDLDSIHSLEDFITHDCGWKYIR